MDTTLAPARFRNDSTGALVTAINNQSTNTGVTASVDTDGMLVLTQRTQEHHGLRPRPPDSWKPRASARLQAPRTYTGQSFQLNDDESFEITSASSVED